tara:strand:- start:1452 stop:1802 length:351 start_codon:yes stop_codon:yes gene_type:complete
MPQFESMYNGMLSGYRNMFVSSSLAIALIGFSDRFTDKPTSHIASILGGIVLCLSIYIGFIITDDVKFYLNYFNDDLPTYISPERWHQHFVAAYVYMSVIALFAIAFFIKKVRVFL